MALLDTLVEKPQAESRIVAKAHAAGVLYPLTSGLLSQMLATLA